MNASQLVFPRPRTIREKSRPVTLPQRLGLEGPALPAWLVGRLRRACSKAGIRLVRRAKISVVLKLSPDAFAAMPDTAIRAQAYKLTLAPSGAAGITAAGPAGLQHGMLTLALLLEARGAGAALGALDIEDSPAFAVRGVQTDMAREFFPSMSHLKRLVDRLVDLKLNTLWLYLENHFRTPGLEDLSPKKGMTPAQAEEISRYAAERGIDVVPATNLMSHMEGWFRLERYGDFCDGSMRSHPVLGRPEAMALAKKFARQMARAFPSKNFHAGLDEYLFVGNNPEAAREIKDRGKAELYGEFCRRIILYLQSLGKTVWFWDDMVTGKNVERNIGFNESASKALAMFPKDAVLTHWWYWLNENDKHAPMIERVRKSGMRFVVAPTTNSFRWAWGNLDAAWQNQAYLARTGLAAGAFGYVCTQWENSSGSSFEATWPLLAMSAEQAWSGGTQQPGPVLPALSFTLTGETTNALGTFLQVMTDVENMLGGGLSWKFRKTLLRDGPYQLWRQVSPRVTRETRRKIAAGIRAAEQSLSRLGTRDPLLPRALRLGPAFFTRDLAILDAFDQAWAHYHRAAVIERMPARKAEFRSCIRKTLGCIQEAIAAGNLLRRELHSLESLGQAPYDAYGLGKHLRALRGVAPLIRQVVKDGNGLPYFERLFYLPDSFFESDAKQFETRSLFHERHPGHPWPIRWADQPRPR